MTKQEFLKKLKRKLSGLSRQEALERVSFYSEMIDDRIEEGLSESEAILAIGSVDSVASEILESAPKKERKKRSTAEITLLILGSPVWISLIIAAFAVVLSLYISLCAVVICIWAVGVSLFICGFVGVFAGIFYAVIGHGTFGLALVGVSLVCLGLSVFVYFGCKAATKGAVKLTKKIISGIKK